MAKIVTKNGWGKDFRILIIYMVWFQTGCNQMSQHKNIPVKWKCWVSKYEENKKTGRQCTDLVLLGNLCQQVSVDPSLLFQELTEWKIW